MHKTALAAFAILCVIATHSAAQEALSAEETAWLNGVVGAGFKASSSAGGVTVSARDAAVFSEHLKPVLAKQLTDKQRDALLEFARIEVTAAGWVNHYSVQPGTYTVGVRQGKHNLQLVTRDAKGSVIDVDGAWLNEGTDSKPTTSASAQGGKAGLEAAWGGVKFTWTYVSKQAHTNTLGAMTERKSGNVSVFSDLPDEAHIQRIADLCGKAVAANETLTGGKLPAGFRYELYLPGTKDAFTAIDNLLTGGDFAQNGAFTSFLTGRSYIWYYTHYGEAYALPSSLLEVCIHELHHQFIYAAFPCMRNSAGWWQESLAEVAAQQGLELCDKQAAENYRKRRLTELEFFSRAGRMPGAVDFLADKPAGDIGAYYTAAWTLGSALASNVADVHAMCRLASEHEVAEGANNLLLREFDKRYVSVENIFKVMRARANTPWYMKWNATVDERDGVLEVNTELALGGFALVSTPVKENSVTLSGEFRWDNQLAPQADFVFAYALGASTERFLKVALLPTKAVLFSFTDGEWATLATVNFDSAQQITQDGKPLWHKFALTYDAEAGKVRLETTNGRWAEFKLNDYWPVRDAFAGVGTYDGVAWFRGVAAQ